MKQYSKKLFSLVVLCSTANVMLNADDNSNNNNRVLPFLQYRSQGRDNARKLYGTTSYGVYQPDQADSEGLFGKIGAYGTFNATIQYDQSFRGKNISRALFGPALVDTVATTATGTTTTNKCNDSCGDETIVISGLASAAISPATTRGAFDLMAENFLLPRDFRSTISFSPKVQDVVLDLNLFVGLDRWVNGMYFRLYGPVAWNKATLKPSESITTVGTPAAGAYAQGFFDPNAAVPATNLFQSALSYFGGCTLPAYTDQEVTVQPLRFAKFSDCNLPSKPANSCDDSCSSFSHHKTGFAELRGELGYNYMSEKYRFLINLQAAAPTGTKVKAEYLLPAQVGNGHHWELGVGLGGAWRMWCNEDMERSFNFIVEADITHLFNAKQERTFDLKCKPLSRYMLAEQLLPVPATFGGAATLDSQLVPNTPIFQATDANIDGTYAPVANFSTRDVKVSIGVQGDLVAMFNYTSRGFSWDLGYNFWAMSSSKISLSDTCDTDACNNILPFPTNFALKGDASVAGYDGATNAVYGLGATESKATIFAGVGAGATNANIDNAQPAAGSDGATPPAGTALLVFPGGATSPAINTSVQPIFISIDDLDIAGAEQRGLSHKVFTHFNYTWRECSDRWMPYVGAGFSAEFGSHSSSGDCPVATAPTTLADCDTCPSSLSFALSKWAVEIKGGVSFH